MLSYAGETVGEGERFESFASWGKTVGQAPPAVPFPQGEAEQTDHLAAKAWPQAGCSVTFLEDNFVKQKTQHLPLGAAAEMLALVQITQSPEHTWQQVFLRFIRQGNLQEMLLGGGVC